MSRIGRFRVGAPLGAAVMARLAQLVLLIALAMSEAAGRDLLLVGFALISSFAIATDSGASTYLLTLGRSSTNQALFDFVLRLQVISSLLGLLVAASILLVQWTPGTEPSVGLTLGSIALAQMADAAGRVARMVPLSEGDDLASALPEFWSACFRLLIVLAALASGGNVALWFLWIGPAAIAIVSIKSTRRRLDTEGGVPRLREVLVVGSGNLVSSLYSQTPIVIGAVFFSPQAMASIAFAYRLIQPLEVIPGTISQQAIPRLQGNRLRFSTYAIWSLLTGLLFCLIVVLASLSDITRIFEDIDFVIVSVVALSLMPKFVNYALVARALAHGAHRGRLLAASGTGALMVVAVVVVGVAGAIDLLPWTTLGAELTLFLLLISLTIRRGEVKK